MVLIVVGIPKRRIAPARIAAGITVTIRPKRILVVILVARAIRHISRNISQSACPKKNQKNPSQNRTQKMLHIINAPKPIYKTNDLTD